MAGFKTSLKASLQTTKGKVIAGAAAAGTAVAAAAVVMLIIAGTGGFRTIAVNEVNGTSIVSSSNETQDAYPGMHLHSGDDVKVQAASDMTMLLDMDKYLYAEPNTHFWLEASGTESSSKTSIYMDAGATLHRLDSGLATSESYTVNTPNSVMSVRGTVFRVSLFHKNGELYTQLEVYQGVVKADLIAPDGKPNGVSEEFSAGQSALIRMDSEISEFVVGEDGDIHRPMPYGETPRTTAEKIVEYMDAGCEMCIGKELFQHYTALVPCVLEDTVVREPSCSEEGLKGKQCTVCGQLHDPVSIPKLPHTLGEWETVTEPTCTAEGKRVQKCTVCHQDVNTEVLPALGHKRGRIEVITEATCTAPGRQEVYCEVCGELMATETIPAKQHTPGKPAWIKKPTCTEPGEQFIPCAVCGAEISRSVVPPTGHNYGGWYPIKDGDCVTPGQERRDCVNCGKSDYRDTAIAGHQLVYQHKSPNLPPAYDPNKNGFSPVHLSNVPVLFERCTVCGYSREYAPHETPMHSGTFYASGWEIEKEYLVRGTFVCDTCGQSEELVAVIPH